MGQINYFAVGRGVDPHTFHRTTSFQDQLQGRLDSPTIRQSLYRLTPRFYITHIIFVFIANLGITCSVSTRLFEYPSCNLMHHTFYSNRSYLSYSFQPYETSLILNFHSAQSLHIIDQCYKLLWDSNPQTAITSSMNIILGIRLLHFCFQIPYIQVYLVSSIICNKGFPPNLGDSTMGFLAITLELSFSRLVQSANSVKNSVVPKYQRTFCFCGPRGS